MSPRIACAVLAAGASRRLGYPKQLLQYDGVPLVRRAARAGLDSRCVATLVVLGAYAARVRAALHDLPLSLRENPEWSEGIASSVRVAARWASEQGFDGLLLSLCDQPRLTPQQLSLLVFTHHCTGMPVASRYAGGNGVPALFPASHWPALLGLSGDAGARSLLDAQQALAIVPWPEGAQDVDTPEQARRLLGPQAAAPLGGRPGVS